MSKKKLVLLICSIVLGIALIVGAVIAIIRLLNNKQDTETVLNQIDVVTERFEELKNSDDYDDLDTDEKTKKVMGLLDDLSKEGYINSDTIYLDEEEHIVTYEYSSGVIGCELIEGFDENLDDFPTFLSFQRKDEFYEYSGDDRHSDALILNAMTDRAEVITRC